MVNQPIGIKDIFTKVAGNVYGYKNLSAKFSLHLKKKMAAIAYCLNIIAVL